METKSDNVDSSKQSPQKSSGRKKYNKWDPWSTTFAGLLFLNFIFVIAWFIIDPSFFDSAKDVVKTVWSVVIALISVLGIVSGKTTILRLLRLPPIRLIIVIFTIATVIISLIVLPIHCIEFKITYNKNNQVVDKGIELKWREKNIEPTKSTSFENLGATRDSIFEKNNLKMGEYYLIASFANESDTHLITIGLSPFIQRGPDIELKPKSGSLFIKTIIDNKYISGARIYIDSNISKVHTPGEIKNLKINKHLVQAGITINSVRYFGGKSDVSVIPSITDTIDIILTPQSKLPSDVRVIAKYKETEYPSTIIKDGDTLNKTTPYTIQNLKEDEVDIKVFYRLNNILYESETVTIPLKPGHNDPVVIELKQKG